MVSYMENKLSSTVIDSAEFVRLWMQADRENRSRSWIGEQIGRTEKQVSGKGFNLKKGGVKLPFLPTGSPNHAGVITRSVNELNLIIEEERNVQD